MTSTPSIAFVAEGKLYTQKPGEPARLIDSTFVQTILDRVEKNRQRNEWKSEGMAWQFASRGASPFGLPGARADVRRVRFCGVTAGAQGKDLLYVVDTDYVSGLFHHDLSDGSERRLYHRNQFRATDLAHHPDGTLAFTVRAPDGTSHIATMSPQGRGIKEVTEGDAIDEAPSWVPGQSRTIVFQSAGVGRNEQGMPTALSPYAVQRIDLENNKMDMLIEEDETDALLPRMTAEGFLYYIRRPYQPFGQPVSPLKVALDILLFPFRLVRALAHFLNFFSMMFSRKPLMTAGGPPKEGPDQRFLMLWGRALDANKALRKYADGKNASLVPATWELVKRIPDGSETVLAKHVLSYDLCPDGSLVYTNGVRVLHLTPGAEPQEITTGKLIERVAVIG